MISGCPRLASRFAQAASSAAGTASSRATIASASSASGRRRWRSSRKIPSRMSCVASVGSRRQFSKSARMSRPRSADRMRSRSIRSSKARPASGTTSSRASHRAAMASRACQPSADKSSNRPSYSPRPSPLARVGSCSNSSWRNSAASSANARSWPTTPAACGTGARPSTTGSTPRCGPSRTRSAEPTTGSPSSSAPTRSTTLARNTSCGSVSAVSFGSRPTRRATRSTCRSTGMSGSSKQNRSMTLAVFLPTPGIRTSQSRASSAGRSPRKSRA